MEGRMEGSREGGKGGEIDGRSEDAGWDRIGDEE